MSALQENLHINLDNLQNKTIAFWAIKSELNVGLEKILRKNYPTNQIEVLQILSNAGIPTKVIIRNLDNDIICRIQIIWQKDITQKDLRFGIQSILLLS